MFSLLFGSEVPNSLLHLAELVHLMYNNHYLLQYKFPLFYSSTSLKKLQNNVFALSVIHRGIMIKKLSWVI